MRKMSEGKDKDQKLKAKILKQVEFYFGDSNLPKDNFLKGETKKNEEGWVDISIIASFKKLQSMTKDIDIIIAALRGSEELLEVSEDGKRVRRVIPLSDDAAIELDKRSIFAKPFPTDLENPIEKLNDFFSKYGSVKSVRVRRTKEGIFRGSVFVEFSSIEEAKKVSTTKIVYEDQELLIHMKPDYFEILKAERKEKNKKKRKEREEEEEKDEHTYDKDLIISFKNLKEDKCTRETLKLVCAELGFVARYCDYSKGQNSGFVRLEKGSAKAFVEKFTKENKTIDDVVPELKALEGEEEEKYWKTIFSAKSSQKKRKRKFKR